MIACTFCGKEMEYQGWNGVADEYICRGCRVRRRKTAAPRVGEYNVQAEIDRQILALREQNRSPSSISITKGALKMLAEQYGAEEPSPETKCHYEGIKLVVEPLDTPVYVRS